MATSSDPEEDAKEYDSSEYMHDAAVYQQYGIPVQYSAHYSAYFMRWLAEHQGLTDRFWEKVAGPGGPRVFPDEFSSLLPFTFMDYMVQPEWRSFVDAYYEGCEGPIYGEDYETTMQGSLPTWYHIPFNDEYYARLRPVLDRRLAEWRNNADGWQDKARLSEKKWKRQWFWKSAAGYAGLAAIFAGFSLGLKLLAVSLKAAGIAFAVALVGIVCIKLAWRTPKILELEEYERQQAQNK